MLSRAPLQTSWREAIALVEQSEYHRFTTDTKARAIKKPGGVLPASRHDRRALGRLGRLAALDQLSTERKAVRPPAPPRRSGYGWRALLPIYTYITPYLYIYNYLYLRSFLPWRRSDVAPLPPSACPRVVPAGSPARPA